MASLVAGEEETTQEKIRITDRPAFELGLSQADLCRRPRSHGERYLERNFEAVSVAYFYDTPVFGRNFLYVFT